MQNQRYETICLQCVTKNKETARDKSIHGAITDSEDDAQAFPYWGPVYLDAAARAILTQWYRKAQENVWGKVGRRRPPVSIYVSDDESDDVQADWAVKQVDLSNASKALAIRWLRTARASLQQRGKASRA